ncbi:hypothetical protein [Streptomyces varsoviensis]|nr:hypothetical protein [Streptomyces varsoviensis]
MRLRLPEEHPTEPPTGYKIAYPVLSHNGRRAGFTGVSLGGGLPYGVLDDARCVYGRRHRCPSRRCDCGFHCLHSRDEALGLTCLTEHRRAVVLEITVLGSYIRYERGMRYARQRVRIARVGPCSCGRASDRFADAGWGRAGWRTVTGSCAGCAADRMSISFPGFARLAGERLTVSAAPGTAAAAPPRPEAGGTVPELVAEAALLQARLDWFQSELAKVIDRDEP